MTAERLERLVDLSRLFCNLSMGTAILAWALLCGFEFVSRVDDVVTYQGIAEQCVRSLGSQL
ncbi:hypothetical protein [Variovorax sp. PBL-E5]|uniref:hypothetical protein n=1 Tax=Variovorax sp. PBL-E5 TaxID=434014 RepID=UPI0013A54E71|nr:hypothetical protein [Variovorax sp. PBL-E5]